MSGVAAKLLAKNPAGYADWEEGSLSCKHEATHIDGDIFPRGIVWGPVYCVDAPEDAFSERKDKAKARWLSAKVRMSMRVAKGTSAIPANAIGVRVIVQKKADAKDIG